MRMQGIAVDTVSPINGVQPNLSMIMPEGMVTRVRPPENNAVSKAY